MDASGNVDTAAVKPALARKRRRSATRRWAILLFLAVNLLSAVYFLFLAADVYVSKAAFSIRTISSDSGASVRIPLITVPSNDDAKDAHAAIAFIASWKMYEKVHGEVNFVKHYSGPPLDFLARLDRDETREGILEYFRRRVRAEYHDATGLVTIHVEAFDAPTALRISQIVVEEAERVINDFSLSVAREHLAFVESDAKRKRDHFVELQAQFDAFQRKYNIINPTGEASIHAQVVAQLESEIAKDRAQLDVLMKFLSPESVEVVRKREEIEAKKRQIELIKKQYLGAEEALAGVMSEFRKLNVELKLSEETYKSALASLETARVEVAKKIKKVVVVGAPFLPQEALLPRRAWNMVTVAAFALIALLLLGVIGSVVREHGA